MSEKEKIAKLWIGFERVDTRGKYDFRRLAKLAKQAKEVEEREDSKDVARHLSSSVCR